MTLRLGEKLQKFGGKMKKTESDLPLTIVNIFFACACILYIIVEAVLRRLSMLVITAEISRHPNLVSQFLHCGCSLVNSDLRRLYPASVQLE